MHRQWFAAASDKSPLRIRALAELARSERDGGDTAAAAHAPLALAAAREAAKGFTSTGWLGEALVAQSVVDSARGDTAAAQASLQEAVAQLEGALGADAAKSPEARALLERPS